MDESNEPKFIVSDINIIYKPKPKRLYKTNLKLAPHSHVNKIKKQKHKKSSENFDLNLKKQGSAKSQNIDLMSFKKLKMILKFLKQKVKFLKLKTNY